jgi:hypothetical protein
MRLGVVHDDQARTGAGRLGDGGELHPLVLHRRDPEAPDVVPTASGLQAGAPGCGAQSRSGKPARDSALTGALAYRMSRRQADILKIKSPLCEEDARKKKNGLRHSCCNPLIFWWR